MLRRMTDQEGGRHSVERLTPPPVFPPQGAFSSLHYQETEDDPPFHQHFSFLFLLVGPNYNVRKMLSAGKCLEILPAILPPAESQRRLGGEGTSLQGEELPDFSWGKGWGC